MCLRSVDPSPPVVRKLVRRIFDMTCMDRGYLSWPEAWRTLLGSCAGYRDLAADEVDAVLTETIQSGGHDLVVRGLQLTLSLPYVVPLSPDRGQPNRGFWSSRGHSNLLKHARHLGRRCRD